MPSLDFVVRRASIADLDIIARHRAEMYRDIHAVDDARCALILDASRLALAVLLESGEYLGWLVSPSADPGTIIAGAGIRLRGALPGVRTRNGVAEVIMGRQGLVVNVYTERQWRRRGVAALAMRALLQDVRHLEFGSIVLHASDDGRALYESLGFVATNEMRYEGLPLIDSKT